MNDAVVAAAVQMVSSDQVLDNLSAAGDLIAQAVEAGAELVVLPENFAFMGRQERAALTVAEPNGDGPIQDFLADCAAKKGITLVGGSVPIQAQESDRVRSALLVYGPDGNRIARYDKRHLFDVRLPGGEGYRESATFAPGHEVLVADTPVGRLGLSICYDLRFPEHYRRLVEAGAEILLAPAAFTATTGKAHWEILLRARAVENLCFMIAPDQGGEHASGRFTHGQSMLIDPWGVVLAQCPVGGGPGVAVATLDRAHQAEIRARLPALSHRLD